MASKWTRVGCGKASKKNWRQVATQGQTKARERYRARRVDELIQGKPYRTSAASRNGESPTTSNSAPPRRRHVQTS